MRIGVASEDGERVDQHFGRARRFAIYQLDANGFRLIETRDNRPSCACASDEPDDGESGHDGLRMGKTIDMIADCDAVIVAQVGEAAIRRLAGRGIRALMIRDSIDAALKRIIDAGGIAGAACDRAADSGCDPTGCETMCAGHRMRDAARHAPLKRLEGRHPCFSRTAEGHARSGRLHLPVSPACNINCRFCRRGFNRKENRPGVARALLAPDDAVAVVGRALELLPAINVVGIAGPGDTLATDHALRTFELVHAAYPHLIKCLSTNGLLLAEKAERLIAAGVGTVTVTVNAVDPAILERICSSIVYQRRRLTGLEAAERLIVNQLEAIRKVAGLGAVVKINSVLVPGINENHFGAIAEATAAVGASLINVIPLIPQHEFTGRPTPTVRQMVSARREAGRHLTVFTHCQRCRADAAGIPGRIDIADRLHGGTLGTAPTFSHG